MIEAIEKLKAGQSFNQVSEQYSEDMAKQGVRIKGHESWQGVRVKG